MELQTGDWVMIRKLKPLKLAHRGILLIADHTHDELLDLEGPIPVTGNAENPYFSKVAWDTRLAEVDRGEIAMAVFRWHEADNPNFNIIKFKTTVHIGVWLLSYLKIPYDNTAIKTHVRNYLRAFLKMRFLMKHTEAAVFCTESCFAIFRAFGIDLSNYVGIQHLVAPCHADKLYREGKLKLVKDYGLEKYLKPLQRYE